MIKSVAVVVMFVLIASYTGAQILSPRQTFEVEIRERYQGRFVQEELHAFLRDLSWSVEQLRRAERVLGANAIRMSTLFGDYSGLLRYSDDELAQMCSEMIPLLGVDFSDFWNSLKPQTKHLFFQNPAFLRSTLDILKHFNEAPNSFHYKRLLGTHPDYLVFLYRFPALMTIQQDRLPILLHFLQHIDLNSENLEQVAKLNEFLPDWHRCLIPLYVANQHDYGVVPALTMWAMPVFFRNQNPNLREDLQWNQQIWSVLLSQMGFIRERQNDSLDWPSDAGTISTLLNRKPTKSNLSRADWVFFLLQTAPADGKALKMLWQMRHNTEQLETVDHLLSVLKIHDIPFSVILNLLKLSQNHEDFLFLTQITLDPRYEPSDKKKTKGSGGFPLPILIMSELDADPQHRFIQLLSRHRFQLIAYLNDQKRGPSVQDRFALAIKTDLKDAVYDESALKQLSGWVPGGNLANVVVKSIKGYPVSGIEATLAAVDIARAALFVATLGGSEVATTAGQQAAVEAGQRTAEQTTKKTAEAATKAFWASVQEFAVANQETIKGGLSLVESVSKDIAAIQVYFDEARNEALFAKKEIAFFEQARQRKIPDIDRGIFVAERFGHLPLRSTANRYRTLLDKNNVELRIALPSTNQEWLLSLQGADPLNRVLFVTLGDLQ